MDINDRWLKLAQRVNEIIWDSPGTTHKLFDRTAKVSSMARGLVHSVQYGNMLFLTQNPAKNSAYGHMASEGHKIIWGILQERLGYPQKEYVLRIVDGEVSLINQGEWEPLGKLSEQNQHVQA